jgi:hypothetical protein
MMTVAELRRLLHCLDVNIRSALRMQTRRALPLTGRLANDLAKLLHNVFKTSQRQGRYVHALV